MRQVFTSPRLENVERVAALLKEHGVEARITNGRSYRGSVRGNFSYREAENDKKPQPAVWVVTPDDQPKARELLRDAGLLDSGRSPTSYLSTDLLHGPRVDGDPAKRRVLRIKAALLISITIAITLGLLSWRKSTTSTPPATTTTTPAEKPVPAATPGQGLVDVASTGTYQVAMPSALAAMLFNAELRAHDTAEVCLSVDGAELSETISAQLQAKDATRIRPRSACTTETGASSAVKIEVREYRTDGSGTGTVQIEITDTAADGKTRVEQRTLEVQRDGLDWKVKRILP
jgi:hypothetical protein